MVCSVRELPSARSPAELDAFVLCGGLGTRLRAAVPDGPKALARVAGRPFLAILVQALAACGVRRFVLCAGHGADAIEAALPGLSGFGRICVSREERPLGTGGAVRRALSHAAHAPLLVVNGDSLCPLDLAAMLDLHRARGAELTLAAVRDSRRTDSGQLAVDARGRVVEFAEKRAIALPGSSGAGLVNAGIYLVEPGAFAALPAADCFSLERELIPALLPGRVHAFESAGPLLDIGTPERLRGASEVLREMGMRFDA